VAVHDAYIDGNLLEGLFNGTIRIKHQIKLYMDIKTTRSGQEIPRREGSTQVKGRGHRHTM